MLTYRIVFGPVPVSHGLVNHHDPRTRGSIDPAKITSFQNASAHHPKIAGPHGVELDIDGFLTWSHFHSWDGNFSRQASTCSAKRSAHRKSHLLHPRQSSDPLCELLERRRNLLRAVAGLARNDIYHDQRFLSVETYGDAQAIKETPQQKPSCRKQHDRHRNLNYDQHAA